MSKTIEQITTLLISDRNQAAYENQRFFVDGLDAPVGLKELLQEIIRRLNLSSSPDGSETKVNAGSNVTVTGSGTTADPYVIAATGGSAADGSETKVNAGSNVTVTGSGTTADPYVIAATGGSAADGSETKVNAGANITVTGSGTTADPYVIGGSAGGGGSFARDSLSSGTVTVKSDRLGGSFTVLSNPAPGEYELTVQAGAHVANTTIFGNNTTLNASQEMIIRLDNSANTEDRRFLVQLYDANNGSLVDQQVTGTVHTQAVAGNVTTITIPGLNGFGTTGFYVELR